MSRYSDTDTYSQAGDWLMGSVRRNPEALLLLAAGCVLLMRSGGSTSFKRDGGSRYQGGSRYNEADAGHRSTSSGDDSSMRRGISRATEAATDYASDIKERVSDAVGSYAESVSGFADDARRTVSQRSEQLTRQAKSGLDRVLRDQPLAVVMAGLAAGAAVAAAFPRTEIENRAFGGTREALTEAATRAGEAAIGAAGKAGERLKTAVEERGLTEGLKGVASESLKGIASDVADAFSKSVSGKSDEHGSATTVPQSTSPGISPGTSSGIGSATGAGSGQGDRSSSGAPASAGSGGRSSR